MSRPVVSAAGLLYLWMLLLLLLPWSVDSCMECAWSRGRLGSRRHLQAVTLNPASASSCICCALCHRERGCASLSYSSPTAECQLYGSVASYDTLQPDMDEEWKYFVMPGRSERGQFCRQDSDCRTEGDACRGRVCTDRDTVTCRVIAETFGAGGRFGTSDVGMFGWLDSRETALECDSFDDLTGFTELLSIRSGANIGNGTILELNHQLDPSVGAHSILGLTDTIRQLRQEPTYHVVVSTDSEYVLTEVSRDETLAIEKDGKLVHISFRSQQGIRTRMTIPTEETATASYVGLVNYEGMQEGDGLRKKVAHDWIEIYIRK